jgi:exodeoxyribonuclease VII small subunit
MAKKKSVREKTPSFEQSLAALESIVRELEGGQLPLADSLEQYERGVQHLKRCYDQLSAAERRIELVSSVDAAGKPQAEPFEDEGGSSLEEKGARRSRRKSAPQREKGSEVDDSSSLF